MQRIYKKAIKIGIAISATIALLAYLWQPITAVAAPYMPIVGGTGSTTLSGIIIGNGTSAVRTLTVGACLQLAGTTLSATCSNTFAFTPGSYGGQTANSTSTQMRFTGTPFGLIASSTFFTTASTTNFEMTAYVLDWPGADLGAKFANAYAAMPVGTTYIVAASTTQSTVMNMNVAGKVGTIVCSPGVVINWTGAATSTILNATDLNNLQNGWGIRGCTISGISGTNQSAVQVGGSNGGHGATVIDNTFINMGRVGLETTKNTWSIAINNNFFQNNKKAMYFESAANSGEGFEVDHNTFADCTTAVGDCWFLDVNATDGLMASNNILDDAGVHLSDGNLNANFTATKWENPGEPGTGRYTYFTCDSGGFMLVNIHGGDMMNGSADLAHSPWQFGLVGCQLIVNGLTFDNNTGGAISLPSAFNMYGGGSLSVYGFRDVNVGTPTVTVLATSSMPFVVDEQSGLIHSELPLQIYPNGSVAATASGRYGEDGGNGNVGLATAYDTGSGYVGGLIDANPLLLNTNSGNSVGVGTTSPFATLSVMAGDDFGAHAQSTLFAIGSSTAGRATTTLFMVNSLGTTTLGRFGACNTTNALTTNASGQISCGAISGGVTSIVAGNGITISGATGAVTVTNAIGYEFPSNATTTKLALNGGLSSGTLGLNFDPTTNKLSIGSTTPMALVTIVATATPSTAGPAFLFAIASSTAGTATTTVFSIDHYGNALFQGLDPSGNVPIVTFQANSNAQMLFQNINSGSALKLKAQDSKDRIVFCLSASCSNNSDLYFDSDDAGTTRGFFQGSTGRFGLSSTSPTALLSVAGTVAALLTAFATGDGAVCQRGSGGLITLDAGVSSCIVSSKFVKDPEGSDDYQQAYNRVMQLQAVLFKYKDNNVQDIGLYAEDVEKIDHRYAQYATTPRDMDGHHYNVGDAVAINWSAIQTDMLVVLQHQSAAFKITRSMEENWQDGLIAVLLIAVGILFNEVRKLKAKK